MVLTEAGDTGARHYRSPGVFLERVAAQPDRDLVTGVPAFVGFVQCAGDHALAHEDHQRPRFCRRWEEAWNFLHRNQDVHSVEGSFLEYAIKGFFENGGQRCAIAPVWVRRQEDCTAFALLEVLRADGLLDNLQGVDLICVPDAMLVSIAGKSKEDTLSIQRAVLDHCHRMGDRFAVLDTFRPPEYVKETISGATPNEVCDPISHWQRLPSDEGALYFPWIRVKSPVHGDKFIPPCGHVAGVFARTDRRTGIPKAPANEVVEGVLDLDVHVTAVEQERLNEIGVNCLRSFPRRGIRVWGARTLSRVPSWRYVNTRRLFLMLVRWLEANMQDLVFEPNNPSLWKKIEDRVGGYCYGLFRKGMLQGRNPSEAFFIKCDGENNPSQTYDQGQVICDVGLAPLVPAEFIVVRIAQNAAGTTVTVST